MRIQIRSIWLWVFLVLFYTVFFQDLISSLLYKWDVPFIWIRGFTLFKEFVLLSAFLFLIIGKVRYTIVDFWIIFFLLFCVAISFQSELPIRVTLIGLRTYVLFVAAFLVGEAVASDASTYLKIERNFKILLSILVLFSFFEFFILPDSIWKDWFPIIKMKNDALGIKVPQYYNTGLPANYMGESTRRMLGPFGDPLYLAYFIPLLINPLIIRSLYERRFYWVFLGAGLLVLVLTQTRAILVGVILSLGVLTLLNRKILLRHIVLGLLGMVLASGVVVIYFDWFYTLGSSLFSTGGRNAWHLAAYTNGIGKIMANPFGLGPGNSSNLIGFMIQNEATENAFINIGIELGILGLVFFLGFFVLLIYKFRYGLIRELPSTPRYTILGSAYLLLIQFLFAGLVAPQILTARILIPFMLLVGWGYGTLKDKGALT